MKPNHLIQKPVSVFNQSGALEPGYGKVTGVIAFALAGMAVLAVLAFHFPQYLTMPDLRKKYDVNVLREILLVGMVIAGGLAIVNLVMRRNRWLNGTALVLLALAVAGGGHRVPVGDFPDNTPYIGLDWFLLDLLGSSLVFILIEKMFPLHPKQPVFRPGWQVDFTHFVVNHLLVGLTLVIVNFAIHRLFGWLIWPPLQKWVGSLPFFAELFGVLLVADLVQYWTHRAYHEIPLLWRFHAVHHSAEYLDWMAGSRLHLFELLTTRVSILGVLYVLGFSEAAMNVWIVIVGFQAVFNHANVCVPIAFARAPLKWLIVTPDFHHWHHSSEREAIDRNYAGQFAFIDYLFGTAVKADHRFPGKYGVVGDYVPAGWLRQQLFPFIRKH
jgi:sterol desaturase/sphingolipid hydroxylase (fatty acid hydroxylase superfamily)